MNRCSAKNSNGFQCWLEPGHGGRHLVDGNKGSYQSFESIVIDRRRDSISPGTLISSILHERFADPKLNAMFGFFRR